MKVGIVGSEAAKFTAATEQAAREAIRALLLDATLVISGRCHLGGIDIWAVEEATWAGIPTREYQPKHLRWSGGYRERNLLIAQNSDLVVCISVACLPESYTGMRFPKCYHHDPPATDHVKSGGCWTTKQAAAMGKQTRLVVV